MSKTNKAEHIQDTLKGSTHWRLQRISSVLLIPLTVWFVGVMIGLSSTRYEGVLNFMQQPSHALAMIVFIWLCCWHIIMGLEIVIEDYVHQPSYAKGLIFIVNWGFTILAVIATISIFKLN